MSPNLKKKSPIREHNRKQLGSILWKIACELIGAMNADYFHDLMLSLQVLRYLSDNYEAASQKEWINDYPDLNGIAW